VQDEAIDAIATEPPFDEAGMAAVLAFVDEARRVLRPGACISMFCARWQQAPLKARAADQGLVLEHEERIDRKGTDCAVLLWRKP
jgi:hypothetical protein